MSHGRLCDEISRHFMTLINRVQEATGRHITLKIEASCDAGARDVDIKYTACVSFGEDITTRNLYKSIEVAIERHIQNDALEPISLPRN